MWIDPTWTWGSVIAPTSFLVVLYSLITLVVAFIICILLFALGFSKRVKKQLYKKIFFMAGAFIMQLGISSMTFWVFFHYLTPIGLVLAVLSTYVFVLMWWISVTSFLRFKKEEYSKAALWFVCGLAWFVLSVYLWVNFGERFVA